jgi:hypothetical protein
MEDLLKGDKGDYSKQQANHKDIAFIVCLFHKKVCYHSILQVSRIPPAKMGITRACLFFLFADYSVRSYNTGGLLICLERRYMKERWFVIVCLSALLAVLNGCEGTHQAPKGNDKIADTNTFPEFLAGRWTGLNGEIGGYWQADFTPEGRISRYVDIWNEILKENQTTDFNMPGGPSHITAGNFYVNYKPSTRMLSMTAELKDIHLMYDQEFVVDANSTDYFNGPVSEDGNTWTAERIEIFNFSDQPQDPNDISPETVIFKKVQPQAAVADSNEKH